MKTADLELLKAHSLNVLKQMPQHIDASDKLRLVVEVESLRETLYRVYHTLTIHGRVDQDTPLHDRIVRALGDFRP